MLFSAMLLIANLQATSVEKAFHTQEKASHLALFTINNPTSYRITLEYHDLEYIFEPGETHSVFFPFDTSQMMANGKIDFVFNYVLKNTNRQESNATSSGKYSVAAKKISSGEIKAHFITHLVRPGLDLWPPIEPFHTASLQIES